MKAPRDIVDFMIKLFKEKYRTVCAKVAEQKKRGFLDVPLLKHYSRLLKMRKWVESELRMRYLSLGNGRIILAEKLGIRDGDRVLDVGSGDGWFSIQVALRHPGATFYGVELSEEFAEAMEYAEIFGVKNVYFFYFDAYDLPFPDNVFDKVALFFSIANIAFNRKDLVRLFMELRRVLRKGGLMGISEPFVEDFPKNLGEVLRQLYAESHNGETLLYLSDVVWALRKTNFKVVEITKVELRDTGADIGEAKEYLRRHYGVPIPDSVLLSIQTDRIWVHDDPPGYTIIVAKKR